MDLFIKELKPLLSNKKYDYLSFMSRNEQLSIPLYNAILPYSISVDSSLLNEKTDNHSPTNIYPNCYTYSNQLVDHNQLIDLFLKAFAYEKDYAPDNWSNMIDYYYDNDLPKKTYAYYHDDKLIASLISVEHSDYSYIYGIGTDPDYQKQGLSANLMRYYLNDHLNTLLTLNVFESNLPAVKLYEKFNYKRISKSGLVAKDLL